VISTVASLGFALTRMQAAHKGPELFRGMIAMLRQKNFVPWNSNFSPQEDRFGETAARAFEAQ
jgi:hypothetical protein